MLLSKTIRVHVTFGDYKYYKEKGYNANIGDYIDINIEDAPKESKSSIDLKCDWCGESYCNEYRYYTRCKNRYNLDICKNCRKDFIIYCNAQYNKTDYNSINKLYQDNEHELLTKKEYYFKDDDIFFKCKQGHINHKKLSSYKENPCCPECNKEIDRMHRWNEIVNFANECDLEILSTSDDFINNSSKITFRCKCGNPFTTVVREFKNCGKIQCNECGIKLRSGENAPRWKGGLTSDEEKIRKSTDYIKWRKAIYERDNYTCQCCGNNKGRDLQAHHKYNFSQYPELRFDLDNGITLCDACHNFNKIGSFHYVYGATNNTPEQLEEYIKNYKETQSQYNKTSNN